MKFLLKDIVFDEVSTVDSGANQFADVVIAKRTEDVPDEEWDGLVSGDLEVAWSKGVIDSLPDSAFALILPGGKLDVDGKTQPRHLRKFPFRDEKGKTDASRIKHALRQVDKSDLEEGLKKKAKKTLGGAFKLAKESEGKPEHTNQEVEKMDINRDELQPEVKTFIEGLEEKLEAATTTEGELKAQVEEQAGELAKLKEAVEKREAENQGEEDVLKNADPKIKAYFDEIRKDLDESKKRAEEAIAKADSERLAREFEVLKAKAETDFVNLPGTAEEKATLLKALEGMDEATQKVATSILKAGHEAITKAMVEKGSAGKTDFAGTAWAEIQQKAEEIRKEDGKMTRQQAITKAMETNPELYDRYKAEQEKETH